MESRKTIEKAISILQNQIVDLKMNLRACMPPFRSVPNWTQVDHINGKIAQKNAMIMDFQHRLSKMNNS